MKKNIGIYFFIIALLCLSGALIFGTIGAFQFVFPDLLKAVPFFKMRPLHVSTAVGWIIFSAVGGIYFYLHEILNLPKITFKLAKWQLIITILSGIAILTCYFTGTFGGREYWEFPAALALPVIVAWLLFLYNYFKTVFKMEEPWPVYLWMWATGVVFFLYTFLESYLWVFPYFRDNIIRDLTVQWKSYGALVGSWNMLVYGTALFLMEHIMQDKSISRSRLAFLMYALGLTNLMFGWAHHIYPVPNATWVRYIAYGVSMTELLILGKIIYNWRSTLTTAQKKFNEVPFMFICASDFWIFLNLTLALAISVPAINVFTHGTHITVAHAMGSTIGINTMILLSSCFFITSKLSGHTMSSTETLNTKIGFWILNISLLVFWFALLFAGFEKGKLTALTKMNFHEIMNNITAPLLVFAVAGLGILAGVIVIIKQPLKRMLNYISE